MTHAVVAYRIDRAVFRVCRIDRVKRSDIYAHTIVIPYCKKAFPYSNGKIGKEYHENDQRIAVIKQKLNALQTVRHTDETWHERKRLMDEEAKLHKRQSELRTIRDQAGEQMMRMEYQALKELIRDEYGNKELDRLMQKVKEDLSSGGKKPLMYNGYSTSSYRGNVINVTKL